tara:strand:+ start:1156 stop:1905 length:750 start_codon:yes stop_codon:yes gene_type:complete
MKFSFVKRINTEHNSIFYSLINKDDEIIGFGRKHYNKNIIKVVKLNNNFDIIEDNDVDLVGQDPRCFKYNNKIYILDNSRDNMSLIDYETKKYMKLNNMQGKNVSFINHNNILYFIYYIKPFKLYTFNTENNAIIEQQVDDNNKDYNYEYRGGTPGYKLDDNTYYGFGHRTYYKNKTLIHDIFKWVVYFDKELPRISHFNIEQPNNSKNICDPTCVIEINNKKYLITAETDEAWFVEQDYITNVYEIKE